MEYKSKHPDGIHAERMEYRRDLLLAANDLESRIMFTTACPTTYDLELANRVVRAVKSLRATFD